MAGQPLQPPVKLSTGASDFQSAFLMYQLLAGLNPWVSADNGDGSKTLTWGPNVAPTQIWNTPLTANRTVTLATPTSLPNGASFMVVRTSAATGAYTLTVAGTTLLAGQSAIVEYNGSAWMVISAPTNSGGTWTPTWTNGANVSAATPAVGQYLQCNGIVNFSVAVNITPTASGDTYGYLGLPVASNFTGLTTACAGAGTMVVSTASILPVSVVGQSANPGKIQVEFIAPDTTARNIYVTGSYRII